MAKSKKSGKKPKTTKPEVKEEKKASEKKVEEKVSTKPEKVEEKKEKVVSEKKTGAVKKFFAKKYEGTESVLTIFKDKKVYGAILGELFGTMCLSLIVLTLGLYQPLYMLFVMIALIVAVYKLSGANLNPINTVGMMATRRMSVIRGVLYILAQILGAWIGLLIVNAFIGVSESGIELTGMATVAEGKYWIVAMLEFFGASLVGYFFARAQQYRRSAVSFAFVAGGGLMIAMVVVYILSYNYFGLSDNFMLNPAISLMYQILPKTADGVGELLLGIGKALFMYVLFPMIGGTVGFYISDLSSMLAEEK